MAHGDEPEEGEAYGEGYMAPPAHRLRAGTLLIANTNLFEPTFRRSVIFIVEHNDGGTLGVVLNRPSETAVYNVLPQWAKLAGKPKTMFVGGPVKRDAALCLATLRAGVSIDGVKGLRHVAGRMAMVDLDAEPEDIAPLVEGIRVFAGYSGWTIGQLEGEHDPRCPPMVRYRLQDGHEHEAHRVAEVETEVLHELQLFVPHGSEDVVE